MQRLDDAAQIRGHVVIGVAERRGVGFAEPAQIQQHGPVPRLDERAGLIFEQVVGHGPAVEKQHRFAPMGIRIVNGDFDTVGTDVKHLCHHLNSRVCFRRRI